MTFLKAQRSFAQSFSRHGGSGRRHLRCHFSWQNWKASVMHFLQLPRSCKITCLQSMLRMDLCWTKKYITHCRIINTIQYCWSLPETLGAVEGIIANEIFSTPTVCSFGSFSRKRLSLASLPSLEEIDAKYAGMQVSVTRQQFKTIFLKTVFLVTFVWEFIVKLLFYIITG